MQPFDGFIDFSNVSDQSRDRKFETPTDDEMAELSSSYQQSATGDHGNSSQDTPMLSDSDYYRIVWTYISPVILAFGIGGNMLTFVVVRRRSLAGGSTTVYLSAMAVADTAALVLRVVPEWCKSAGLVDISGLNLWTCKIEKFSFYAASDVAIWILAAFTVDRVVAVCLPLSKRLVCTAHKATTICWLLAAIASGKNLHVFWTRGIRYDVSGQLIVSFCSRIDRYEYFEQYVRPWLAFVSVCALPFVVILVCNAFIVHTLAYVRRLRTVVGQRHVTKRTSGSATSLMCIGASLTFLVLVTPSIVLTVGRAYWSGRRGYDIARVVNNQLACLNHAVNFLLYCVTGQRFRRELVNLFEGCRRRRSATTTTAAAAGQVSFSAASAATAPASVAAAATVGDLPMVTFNVQRRQMISGLGPTRDRRECHWMTAAASLLKQQQQQQRSGETCLRHNLEQSLVFSAVRLQQRYRCRPVSSSSLTIETKGLDQNVCARCHRLPLPRDNLSSNYDVTGQ